MLKPYILVVDDEPDMAWAIQHNLVKVGFKVLSAPNGLEALSIAKRHPPALMILDIGMPVMDGISVCLQIRKDPILADTPILFLTAHAAVQERVLGLNHGADDYLTKPYNFDELHARVKALIRRSQSSSAQNPKVSAQPSEITVGEITLDISKQMVFVGEKGSVLTPTEFDLLYFFLTNPHEVFTSRHLLQIIWNYPNEIANPGLVRWHIKNLRNKIELDQAKPRYIVSISHQGYIFNPLSEPESIPT
ncbi:MAG: response regulator transcription factor [Chloroflexi bacterium]|nr:response regulator transcription factor [Chloroflexota bacterium]